MVSYDGQNLVVLGNVFKGRHWCKPLETGGVTAQRAALLSEEFLWLWGLELFNHSQPASLCWSRTAWRSHPESYVPWNLRFQDSLDGTELLHREHATAVLWKGEQSWVWEAAHWTLPRAWRSWTEVPGCKQTWKFCYLIDVIFFPILLVNIQEQSVQAKTWTVVILLAKLFPSL